ncbi:MAG: hypothetical protein HN846_02335 [Candidatus Pacebacteria bacterium]|jgi:hypothetical protein|nr:hypothetical protein [Candidatus Paceibacterota bacterium]MBT3511607.1 hypothetical protein [Candidatus Paceibacterota bacterium]MBT4004696.1 hypothetical protein [Candidatus Paceibacterota bacterium]MBT4359234.1 hypothetical protein [Candidatus Paceibacterota bacterium]MBT4681014.1 hypothetical protein [Candidatus Paceibacterota bacterium]
MSDTIPDLNFNLSFSDGFDDDNESFKFDLFLMTREIKQISSSLKQVTLLPKKQQKQWVRDNQKLLRKFMSNLNHDMYDVLDEMSLDNDVLLETISCVTELRELINTLNSLMVGGRSLIG